MTDIRTAVLAMTIQELTETDVTDLRTAALAAQRLRDQWTIPAYLDDALREAGL